MINFSTACRLLTFDDINSLITTVHSIILDLQKIESNFEVQYVDIRCFRFKHTQIDGQSGN